MSDIFYDYMRKDPVTRSIDRHIEKRRCPICSNPNRKPPKEPVCCPVCGKVSRGNEMIKLNFQWKRKRGQYQTGENLYLNTIQVGGYGWNGTRPRDEGNEDIWKGHISLPLLCDGSERVYRATEAEVKAEVERVVTVWFDEALR